MLIDVAPGAAITILGAMRRIATGAGALPLTPADRAALVAAARFIFRLPDPLDVDHLTERTGAEVARAVPDPGYRVHAVQFLVVMAVVDGTIDERRIDQVVDEAAALDVDEEAVRQLAELGRGNLDWVRADAARQNFQSILGTPDVGESLDEWIQPYTGGRTDAELAARYHALAELSPGTFGRAFADFYRLNRFDYPGEPTGLNARFATPHDSTHVLSGYDTSPQGELLVSTFTAGMHPFEPMSGHILPVIIIWHPGIEIVELDGRIEGSLDPTKFFVAWERGSRVQTDVFGADWEFWAATTQPLEELRVRYAVPPLDAAYAASGEVPPWYHPIA